MVQESLTISNNTPNEHFIDDHSSHYSGDTRSGWTSSLALCLCGLTGASRVPVDSTHCSEYQCPLAIVTNGHRLQLEAMMRYSGSQASKIALMGLNQGVGRVSS
jgi:hypothetical protein